MRCRDSVIMESAGKSADASSSPAQDSPMERFAEASCSKNLARPWSAKRPRLLKQTPSSQLISLT